MGKHVKFFTEIPWDYNVEYSMEFPWNSIKFRGVPCRRTASLAIANGRVLFALTHLWTTQKVTQSTAVD